MGKKLIFMPECHSTNDLAQQLCQQNHLPEGTLIITANQTAGRGQRGNTWVVEPGKNLTFTVVIKPGFLRITDQFYLNIVTSLAVRDYIKEKLDHLVHIKWPNDVLADGKKICGILIENQIRGHEILYSIVGIGLNVNQQQFDIGTATSLCQLTATEYNLEHELETLLHRLEVRYLQLKQGKFELLMEDYLKTMYWLHEPHTFSANEHHFEGTILGLAEGGRLKISVNGQTKNYGVKEIAYIR